MIDLYYWNTPNGWKVSIMLEECGTPYTPRPINIARGEQFAPDFLRIAPNNRIPAIVDHDPPGGGGPLSVFESGAILQYLGDKTGKFLPQSVRERYEVLQWVTWQVASLGPMVGQWIHFATYAPEKLPYAIKRYENEMNRLLGVLNRRLSNRPYLAGEYSIADIAAWAWVFRDEEGKSLSEFPHVDAWWKRVAARPAVQRGRAVGAELPWSGMPDEATRKILFEQTAASVARASGG